MIIVINFGCENRIESQCHIRPKEGIKTFKRNLFVGIQELKSLSRPQPAAPPLIPHRVFMRENWLVCHGDASRKQVTQTTHAERWNCLQCHVEQNAQVELFKKNTNITDAF